MIFITGLFFSTAFADDHLSRESLSERASHFVVKIENFNANVFTAKPVGGHGTGFVAQIDKSKIIVFTNRHVVEANNLSAQKIYVTFPSPGKQPKRVEAKLKYLSRINDFAVLEVDVTQHMDVLASLTVAPFPPATSEIYNFSQHVAKLRGRAVFALGNPLNSNDISTYGYITGIHVDPVNGNYIQTQTPINPGNSGGPLMLEETGEVVGMNTAMYQGANSVGFSLPIGVLLEEYREWLATPSIANEKSILALFGFNPRGELELAGVDKIIVSAAPNFFDYFDGTLRVQDATPTSMLKSGDQVIAVNNHLIGQSYYSLRLLVQEAVDGLDFMIVRNHKIETVRVPVVTISPWAKHRFDLDFVYLSGLVFREVSQLRSWASDPKLESKVIIADVIDSAETNFSASRFPDKNSYVVGVTIENEYVVVKTLLDLKLAIQRHSGANSIRLHVREAVHYFDQTNQQNLIVTTKLGQPMLSPHVMTYLVPLQSPITPFQFSMHRFKDGFQFSQSGFATRDWQNFVRKEHVPSNVAKLAMSCNELLEPTK